MFDQPLDQIAPETADFLWQGHHLGQSCAGRRRYTAAFAVLLLMMDSNNVASCHYNVAQSFVTVQWHKMLAPKVLFGYKLYIHKFIRIIDWCGQVFLSATWQMSRRYCHSRLGLMTELLIGEHYE